MSNSTTRAILITAIATIETAQDELYMAMALAKEQNLPHNYIDAINKAITDNQATWLHVNNIVTLLSLPADPLPL